MENMDCEDYGCSLPNPPQQSLADEFGVITTRWNHQQTVGTPQKFESSSHATTPQQVVSGPLPEYDSYKPDYSGSGPNQGGIGQSGGLTSTGPPLLASTYRPDYHGEANSYRPDYDRQATSYRPYYEGQASSRPAYNGQRTSDVHHGQDDKATTTACIPPDTDRPIHFQRNQGRKKKRSKQFKRDLEQVLHENNSPSLNMSRPVRSQDSALTGADATSPDSLNFNSLAITAKAHPLQCKKGLQKKGVNHLRERQQAEKARVENEGRTGFDIIDQPLHTGHRITKSTKEGTLAQRPQRVKRESDAPSFSVLDKDWLKSEAKAVMGLLSNQTSDRLSQTTIQYYHRSLKAIELTIAAQEIDNKRAVNMNKNQLHIVFVEGQAAAKFLERLERERDTILSSPNIPQEELQKINDKIREADIDYHYTLYHPVMEPYCRLYDGTTRTKNICKAYKPGLGIQLEFIKYKKCRKPGMWNYVVSCMDEGTLEGLRLARVKRGRRGKPPTVTMGTPAMDAITKETKWQVADPTDLDVENTYEHDEEDDAGNGPVKEEDDSDSDDDRSGGVRF